MIERPVIGSTTLLTIVISMKRTQITPLLLSQIFQENFSPWKRIVSNIQESEEFRGGSER